MKLTLSFVLALFFALSVPSYAQHPKMSGDGGDRMMRRGADGERGPGMEKFDSFRKMKMIEVLKLKEDDAARYVAKETAHSDAVRKLMEQRNDLLDELRKSLKDDKDAKISDKTVNDVLAVDEQMFKERRRYQDELRAFFTPAQFAKYLVFEREFGRGVRDAIQGMARDKRQSRSREE